MKTAFVESLKEMYRTKEDLFLLSGDLGFRIFDDMRASCLERFYDVGIAEANMIGIASGLAHSGKVVYCYSIIPFLIMRTFEQIRIDVAYHNLNVKLVGFGSGFTYGLEGFTHFAFEDLALMRTLPNMTVIAPADKVEAREIARLSYEHQGPLFIRMGIHENFDVHEGPLTLTIGKAISLNEGKDIALIATGSMVSTAKLVVALLKNKGISAALIDMHTIKPLDVEMVKRLASSHAAIFTIEEHYLEGGLGSAVAEVIAENGYYGIFRRIGIQRLERFMGKYEHLKDKYGLTAPKISEFILKNMRINKWGI
jgi:transketolase